MNIKSIPCADLSQWVDAPNPIVSMAKEYAAGQHIQLHRHQRGQLVYACRGMMELRTQNGYWMLPPQRGVWIPPAVDHEMIARTSVSLRTLYVDVGALALALPCHPTGIFVTPLLRELLQQSSTIPLDYPLNSFEERLLALTLESMLRASENWLQLPMGQDKRLRGICEALLNDPGDQRPLSAWAKVVGATTRTLTRLFLNETGMTFVYWRQQLRIIDAIPRLMAGERISQVADSLGYSSQSAFTVMFKRVTGKSPGKYMDELNAV